jgi:membrane complex biogenesis BtpA family protein
VKTDAQETTARILGRDRALVGMIHVEALPGTPRSRRSVRAIALQAAEEATLLAKAGFDALILENMHDTPYLRREVGPEITAAMTVAALRVRDAVSKPLGIQILAGANAQALAVAHAADCSFVRAEGFVFASVADEGLLDEADAGRLLRYRRAIGADDIAIFADIKKKHSSHAVTADVSIDETAQAAAFFGADGVIVTGRATGDPTDARDVATVRAACDLPVLVGSGVTPDTCRDLFTHAHALIVGSWYKADGRWDHPPDPDRVASLVRAADEARS